MQPEQHDCSLHNKPSDGDEQSRQDPQMLQGLDHENRPEQRVEAERHYQIVKAHL